MFNIKNIMRKSSGLKLNYLDLAVILLVIIIVAGLLLFRGQKKEQWISLSLVVVNEELWWNRETPPYWYVDDFKIGDQARNSLGVIVGEIVDVQVFDVGGPQKKALVSLKLKVTHDKTKDVFIFNYKSLEIGRSLNLTFGNNNLRGFVTGISDVNDFSQQMYDKKIWVLVKDLRAEFVEEYYPGLMMTDGLDREMAVVESVISVENSVEEIYSDIRGQMVEIRSVLLKDVVLQLKVKTFKSQGRYYFPDEAVIKLGERIWVHFPNIVASDVEIVRIIE